MFATQEIIARDNEYFNLNAPAEADELVAALSKFKQECENKWNQAFPRTADKFNALLATGRTLEVATILASDGDGGDAPDPLAKLLMLEELGGVDLDIALSLLSAYPARYLASQGGLAALRAAITEQTTVCWFDGHPAGELPATLNRLLERDGANLGLLHSYANAVLLLLRQGQSWYWELISGSDLNACEVAVRHSGLVFADLVQLGCRDAQAHRALNWKALTADETQDIVRFGARLALYLAATLCGALKVLVERSFKYARSRHSFDKPLIQHQAVAMRLADMLTARDVCHLALDRNGRDLAQGEFDTRNLAGLLFLLSEAVLTITRDAIQIHGGHGYVEEMPLAKGYRDCRTLMSHLQFMSVLLVATND